MQLAGQEQILLWPLLQGEHLTNFSAPASQKGKNYRNI